MNLYVFITSDIHRLGGAQRYVACKEKYLKEHGWDVMIFSGCRKKGDFSINALSLYRSTCYPLLRRPPFFWPKVVIELMIHCMLRQFDKEKEYSRIIIESNADTTSQWGELLAQRIGAKHICFITREVFRGKNTFYADKMDFYIFKNNRGELACISEKAANDLFEGINPEKYVGCKIFVAAQENPVQDVPFDLPDNIEKIDYTISYFGREDKLYVPIIIEDIVSFSQSHIDKKIHFVFIGNVSINRMRYMEMFRECSNVKVSFWGDLTPIPRKIFSYFDLIIAGSGCANAAYREGCLTIVPNAKTGLCMGALGYDVIDSLYTEDAEDYRYNEVLEKALIECAYVNKERMPIEKRIEPDEAYKAHFDIINSSDRTVKYYESRLLCKK